MSKTVKPVTEFKIGDASARTIAVVGAPTALVLIALVGDDTYHVVDQLLDGTLRHRLGPITSQAALDAVQRVIAGREQSITGDSLAAVAGLVGIAAQGGAL